ncbi:hypothetical protein [Pedobacter sp. UBA5917]|jgi:hypothetical protein|uniref:hypothetical protein n=1 Tax=Pedobacter sp. UBA5917 TaxID=1947061 RepID=UPI0025D6D73D|nr:hypothetical protein [Pedobacter sp. UBA5917]
MKKLLIIVMACYGLNARSQVNESRNFLYLNSDSTVYAQKIRLRPDFSGSWSVRADSRKVSTNRIKFFNNEDGFFANTREFNFLGQAAFAERIIEGKINIYQEVDYNDVPYELDYYRFRDYRRQAINTRMFLNKGFSDLKKVNYGNLNEAMADNPKSLALLRRYRNTKITGIAMYVAAGAAIIASGITMMSGSGITYNGNVPSLDNRNDTKSYILLGLGAGLSIGGFFVGESGKKNIERAIDNYNR